MAKNYSLGANQQSLTHFIFLRKSDLFMNFMHIMR